MRGTGHARALTTARGLLAGAILALAIGGSLGAQGPSVGACPLPPADDPRLAQEPTEGPLLRYRFCADWQALPYPEATPTAAADLAARFGPGLAAIWRWDNPSQRWQLFSPRAPEAVNQFDTVRLGDALLVHMDAGTALLRFQLPPDPTFESETVDFPGGRQWIAFPWRGRYGHTFDLVEILAYGSSVLIHCDQRVPTGWCGSRSDENGVSHPINERSEDLVLAHWDLVFVQHAGDIGRGISSRVVSARETFSRPQISSFHYFTGTSVFASLELPNPPREELEIVAGIISLLLIDERWFVGVDVDGRTTWEELTQLEFFGDLERQGVDIPEQETHSVGDRARGWMPIDRVFDLLLSTDLLVGVPLVVAGPGTVRPE